jgi:hypothetical protein
MAQATDGTDPDLVVAKLVEEVTDDKSLISRSAGGFRS